jgi:hypothetical protein
MTRLTLLILPALAFAALPGLADAKSIKSEIPRGAVDSFCSSAGLGEKTASFTKADGTVITGTIHCESENVASADDHGRHAEPATIMASTLNRVTTTASIMKPATTTAATMAIAAAAMAAMTMAPATMRATTMAAITAAMTTKAVASF